MTKEKINELRHRMIHHNISYADVATVVLTAHELYELLIIAEKDCNDRISKKIV